MYIDEKSSADPVRNVLRAATESVWRNGSGRKTESQMSCVKDRHPGEIDPAFEPSWKVSLSPLRSVRMWPLMPY